MGVHQILFTYFLKGNSAVLETGWPIESCTIELDKVADREVPRKVQRIMRG